MSFWEQQKVEARKLPDSELQRHASVSRDNRHKCKDCFCCACWAVLTERKYPNLHKALERQ